MRSVIGPHHSLTAREGEQMVDVGPLLSETFALEVLNCRRSQPNTFMTLVSRNSRKPAIYSREKPPKLSGG